MKGDRKDEDLLDALAWSQLKEPARVAKIAAGLVRDRTNFGGITKVSIAEAVRKTMPPHGRGKAINEAVGVEFERQRPIWHKRRDELGAWSHHKATMLDEIGGRLQHALNWAYAARFKRPISEPSRSNPYPWGCNADEHKIRAAWEEEERKRDKGDTCIAILIYQDVHTVALLSTTNKYRTYCIATVNRLGGEPTYTYLRDSCANLVEAAVSLGGPQVRSAMTRGYPVLTDWIGRRSIIRFDDKTVELPWLINKLVSERNHMGDEYFGAKHAVVLGDQEIT